MMMINDDDDAAKRRKGVLPLMQCCENFNVARSPAHSKLQQGYKWNFLDGAAA